MVDRKPTYRNRITLTYADGRQETATWAYADNPLVEGTPLSKATLMPDDLAAMICPGVTDPTPADGMDGLRRGAGWWYTAVLPRSGWAADTTKTGYSYSQTVNVTPVDGGTAFTANTFTEAPMVNLTGNASSDEALLADLALVAQGFKEPKAGKLKIYLKAVPSGVTSLQIYMRGRANG